MERERLVVVVPCFNEEANVEDAVHDILAVAPRIDLDLVVLLVDDGSTDGTREKIKAICERDSRCQMLLHDQNHGLSHTVLSGVNWCNDEDWVAGHPGDNEIVFDWIYSFLKARSQYDLILGYYQNPIIRTPARRVASAAFKSLVNLAYGFSFKYLNGVALHRAKVFKGLDIKSKGYAWAPELIAKALLRNPMLRVGELPFVARGRKMGETKAFRPRAIAQAMWDFYVGYRSCAEYRGEVVQAGFVPGETPSGAKPK